MQYIPGSSVTLSASLHYLAKNFPLPDDSDVQTRIPQICVDYLSHEWLEEDVWKSWRNMTRHKNEVANGVRLENASWRTWWKQRNKLKTVSPETLNWLKDSDVTWLYGPLHTAAEPVPKPKQSTYVDRYNLEKSSGKKPILKHRTISELLNIPANEHTVTVVQHAAGSPSLEAASMDFAIGEDPERTDSPRPQLPHTRSDSLINRRALSLPVAAVGSPISTTDSFLNQQSSESTPPRSVSPATQSDGTGLSHELGSLSPQGSRRHISFNTFVEQCISIDDPSTVLRPPSGQDSTSSSDEEGEDLSSSSSSLLEMRPTSQVVGSRANERGPILRSNSLSQEREHVTIAPIPPTLLKASEELPAPSPQVVYQPPQGFDWDLSPSNELDESSASESLGGDELSSGSGSLICDLGFSVPQWGRPPINPPTAVGTGVTGSVGPAGLEGDVYTTAGYQEQQRKYHQALAEEAQKNGSVIGMHAGRSKWVSGDVVDDDEDEADEETDEEESEDEETESSEAELEDGEEENGKVTPGIPIVPGSTGSSTSTASSIATVVGDPSTSPPVSTTLNRPSVSRNASQPGKGILKNAGSGGAAVTVGGGTMADGASALHSVPIGIPKTSVSHTSSQPTHHQPQHAPAPSYFHMPPTATMSPPPANPNNPIINNSIASTVSSAGFLSPSQSDAIFSGIVPSNGRGRTATRSRSASSGISDRSRSSSKVSGTSSPLGSVSPSGYGSPTGSRANSVLGNKRSSTDVGVAGRNVAVGVSAAGRNGIVSSAVASARQSSTSPPVGSPLANGGMLPTSNLGTIVANVPLTTDNSAPTSSVISSKGGPPLSRSGISWSRSSGTPSSSQSRLGRTGSGSSLSSSGSSGSAGTANNTTRGAPSAAQVAAAAPSAGAASLPLPVRKPSVGLVLPNGEPRPTVIISPKTPTGPTATQNDSTASSGVSSPSASGGMSVDTREAKLDEAMMKIQAESGVKTPPLTSSSTSVLPGSGSSPHSDADETDTGTFVEHNLANPTPSNSPMMTFTKPLAPSSSDAALPPTPSTPTRSPVLKVVTSSPKNKSLLSTAIVTPSSAAPILTSQATTTAGTSTGGDGTIVGKAADSIVSSAKGLLGTIWGGSSNGTTASR
ncbi:hypothetical protein FRB96_007518 [Tulasnella sp. 330]|nr:hypothetical protein FRB96_007518 [Tulasnella sp. 330]KAG8879861.1 hypothetical protein FRB97_001338 [Tulasnella sp. 331]